MFGKKKKSSSRDYYHSTRFHRQLQQARDYKRVVRHQSSSRATLSKFKISWKAVLGVIIVGALIYLIYVPNFLYVKSIKFDGIDEPNVAVATSEVERYFTSSKLLPQKNIVFLRLGKMQQFLVRPESSLYEVHSIKRNFFKRDLVIEASIKMPTYLVITSVGSYVVNNDGRVKGELSNDQKPEQLRTIRVPQANALQIDHIYLSQSLRQALVQIGQNFPAATNAVIESYEIPESGSAQPQPTVEDPAPVEDGEQPVVTEIFEPVYETEELDPPEITVLAKKNNPPKGARAEFKVYFNVKSDIPHVLQQLQYLLSQMPPDRLNRLFYLDLRTENKSFVCLARTPCAQEPVVVPAPVPTPPTNANTPPTNSNTGR